MSCATADSSCRLTTRGTVSDSTARQAQDISMHSTCAPRIIVSTTGECTAPQRMEDAEYRIHGPLFPSPACDQGGGRVKN